jgi:hypothetical protein
MTTLAPGAFDGAFVTRMALTSSLVLSSHFVRDELPRIRYANPDVSIEINPVRGQPWGSFTPTMVVERGSVRLRRSFSYALITFHSGRANTNR